MVRKVTTVHGRRPTSRKTTKPSAWWAANFTLAFGIFLRSNHKSLPAVNIILFLGKHFRPRVVS
jgi:hypothetical protein